MSTAGRLSAHGGKRTAAPRRKVPREHDSISCQNDRGHWGSRAEFLLACLGLSVGLGNLWRFPYLAYENGGAAFLLPYLLLLVVVGRPVFLMEVALGQYSQLGPIHTWTRAVPLMAGIGHMQTVRAALNVSSYMTVVGYSLHYLFSSAAFLGHQLPWSTCPTASNSECYVVGEQTPCSQLNVSGPTEGVSCTTAQLGSAEYYWRNEVLRLDDEGFTVFGDMGGVVVALVLCLFVGWVITGLCMLYGIKTSGKVVYFTATFPFLLLIILTVMGLQLPGSLKGLKFLFIPKWEKLLEVNVWRKAMEQVLYSLSIGSGGLITFASYNEFNNKVHIDVLILSFLDLLASLLCAVTVFSVLGAMAQDLGHDDVTKVVASGPGLAFVAYPEAIARTLPLPHLWSILFFSMVFLLGLDSMFGAIETLLTAIFDEFPRTRHLKPVVVAALCSVLFCCGIPYCTQKGQYLFYLMDVFLSGVGSLLAALLGCIALQWVYGVKRFSSDLEFMLNYKPSLLMKVFVAGVAPVTLLLLFVGSLARWEWPLYGGTVLYPSWAYTIGGALPLLIMSPVIVKAILHLLEKLPSGGGWRDVSRPSSLWGPGCPVARQRLYEQRRLERESVKHIPTLQSTVL